MSITFRSLSSYELEIVKKTLSYWLDIGQLTKFLNDYFLIAGEGKWIELFITNQLIVTQIEKKAINPYTIGLGFGEIKENNLHLTLAGASVISKLTNKIAIVNSNAEQLFLYMRDILAKSVLTVEESIQINDKMLVLNETRDFLGIGILKIPIPNLKKKENSKKVAIKNIIDLGWYLRKGK